MSWRRLAETSRRLKKSSSIRVKSLGTMSLRPLCAKQQLKARTSSSSSSSPTKKRWSAAVRPLLGRGLDDNGGQEIARPPAADARVVIDAVVVATPS